MSDDLERRIHDAFHSGPLPAAPDRLIDALLRVPEAPVPRRSVGGRSLLGLLVAAALLATFGALAIGGGSLPLPGPTTPTVAPSPTGLSLEYQVLPVGGKVPGSADLTAIVSILEARIATTGAVGATVQADGADRIIVTLPGVTDVEPIRKLIGQTGRVDFVPLGSTEVGKGDTVDLTKFPPLFSSDQIASASVSADQNGQPAIDITLKPEATRLFGDYTAQNVGTYFAITLDGVVLSAPIIQGPIPNGDVQITGGSIDGFDANEAATIVAILDWGAVPFPIQEVASQPTGPSPSAS